MVGSLLAARRTDSDLFETSYVHAIRVGCFNIAFYTLEGPMEKATIPYSAS